MHFFKKIYFLPQSSIILSKKIKFNYCLFLQRVKEREMENFDTFEETFIALQTSQRCETSNLNFTLTNGGIIRYLQDCTTREKVDVIIHYIFLPPEHRHKGLFTNFIRYLQSRVHKIVICGVGNDNIPQALNKANIKYIDKGGDFLIQALR
jgi:hypothetical protein